MTAALELPPLLPSLLLLPLLLRLSPLLLAAQSLSSLSQRISRREATQLHLRAHLPVEQTLGAECHRLGASETM